MMTLQQMCAAALARDASLHALEFEARWYDWGQLRHVANRLSLALAQSGLAPDAPVILIARSRPSAIAALLGLIAQGRSIRMIYPFQSAAGIARDIARLKAGAVIAAAEEFSPEVRTVLRERGIAAIAIEDMDAHAVSGFEASKAGASGEAPDEPGIEILTSGTTGPPKQFPITHAMIAKHLVGAMPEADLSQVPPYLLYFPLGNISGIYSTLPTLLKGQRAVLLDRFSLEKWRDYVRRFRPTATGIPPAAMHSLLEAEIPPEELSSIKSMGFGAAPLDPTLQRKFEERYNIPILLSYGATEFGGPVAAMTVELHAQWGKTKFGSVGRPLPGAQLRVIDANSHEFLPPGEDGLLEVISPRIGPNWIRTADVATIDADGFVFLRGRADGAIMRGGFKILPETIERALLLHPDVSAAGVVGVADQRVAEVPGAAIQLKPGGREPSTAELEAHLRQHLLATHIPVHWRFVETLPKTASFKIDRPAVKRLFEA